MECLESTVSQLVNSLYTSFFKLEFKVRGFFTSTDLYICSAGGNPVIPGPGQQVMRDKKHYNHLNIEKYMSISLKFNRNKISLWPYSSSLQVLWVTNYFCTRSSPSESTNSQPERGAGSHRTIIKDGAASCCSCGSQRAVAVSWGSPISLPAHMLIQLCPGVTDSQTGPPWQEVIKTQ